MRAMHILEEIEKGAQGRKKPDLKKGVRKLHCWSLREKERVCQMLAPPPEILKVRERKRGAGRNRQKQRGGNRWSDEKEFPQGLHSGRTVSSSDEEMGKQGYPDHRGKKKNRAGEDRRGGMI